jgi:hypothetical protein
MLTTLFVWCFVAVPLGIAVVLIAYRARFFLAGVIGIITLMMLVWAGLRFAAMFDDATAHQPMEATYGPTATQLHFQDDRVLSFDMRVVRA